MAKKPFQGWKQIVKNNIRVDEPLLRQELQAATGFDPWESDESIRRIQFDYEMDKGKLKVWFDDDVIQQNVVQQTINNHQGGQGYIDAEEMRLNRDNINKRIIKLAVDDLKAHGEWIVVPPA